MNVRGFPVAVSALFLSVSLLLLLGGPALARHHGTMESPVAPGARASPPPQQAAAAPQGTQKVPTAGPQGAQAPAAPTPASQIADGTTRDDYQLYLKSGDRSPKWDDSIAPAFQSFDEGNLATAGIFLKQAYDKGCRDPLVLFRYGLTRESRGAFKEAADMLAQAADGAEQRYPGHPLTQSIARHAGRALYEADDYQRAGPLLLKALTQTPDDFMLLLMAGQVARMENRLSDARQLFERALAAPPPPGITQPDPKATVLDELIIIAYQQKDLESCQRYLDQALAANPRDAVAGTYRQRLMNERQAQKEREVIQKIVK